MNRLSALALACAGIMVGLPAAAEPAGGEVGISYNVFDGLFEEELDGDITGVGVHAAIAYDVIGNFGVQSGLAFNRLSFDDSSSEDDLDLLAFDFHTYYRIETARVGFFVGRSDIDDLLISDGDSGDADTQLTHFGAEYDLDTGPITFGARAGRAYVDDVSALDVGFVGLDAAYAVNDRFAVLAAFDRIGLGIEDEPNDDVTGSFRTITAGAEYYVTPSVEVSAYVGQLSAESGDFREDTAIYGVGVSYVIGGGATDRSRLFRSLTLPF